MTKTILIFHTMLNTTKIASVKTEISVRTEKKATFAPPVPKFMEPGAVTNLKK